MSNMQDKKQFREYYAALPDDQFQMVALRADLVPEAQEAVTEEMKARGLTQSDLRAFRREMKRNRVLAMRADRDLPRETNLRVHTAAMMLLVWMGAIALPSVVLSGRYGRDEIELSLLFAGGIAVSCFIGLRGRKKGFRRTFILGTVVPLALLGGATLVATVLAILD